MPDRVRPFSVFFAAAVLLRAVLGAWTPRLRRVPALGKALVASLILATLPVALAAAGSDGARPASPPVPIAANTWLTRGDTLFQTVARGAALPDVGLPRAVAQDGAGFIWVGTDAGLARWDGQVFRSFTTERNAASGSDAVLPEPLVNILHSDRRGRLWIGMSSEGLLRYDAEADRFVRPANRTALDQDHVVAIADDGDGGLWVGTDRGLTHVDAAMQAKYLPDTGLEQGQVSAIAQDPRGTLWVAVRGRIYARATGQRRFRAVQRLSADTESLVTALHIDARGRLWASTETLGAFVIDPVTGKIQPVRLPVDTPPRLNAIVESPAARRGTASTTVAAAVWIASRSGIFRIDPTTLVGEQFAHNPALENSLVEDVINSMVRDRDGLIWIVGDASLSYLDLRARRASTIVQALGFGASGNRYDAWSIGQAPDGTLWTGSADGRVHVVSAARRAVNPRILADSPKGVLDFAFPPGRGAFLAGEEGLDQLGLDGRLVRRVADSPMARLLVDGDTLHLGGNDGMARLDLRDPRARVIPQPWSPRLSNQRVRAIAKAPDGALWIGTTRGLNRVDPATGAVFSMLPARHDPQGLSGSFVSTLLFDRYGRLWAGTIGGGLNIIAPHRGRWRVERRLTHADGLPHNTIDKLLYGADRAVWVSTDGGIARIDPDTFAVDALHPSDGVAFEANWTNAGVVLPGEPLAFASYGGLTIIDTRMPRPAASRTALQITGLKVGHRAIHGTPNPLVIPAGARSLQISFAALDYAAVNEITYAYRLQNLETAWTRTDARHGSARYTNLPPGNFLLEIRAWRGDGRPLGTMLRLAITVEPQWHERLVVRLLVVALIILAVFALIRLRTRAARRRQQQLEDIVARRTAELQSSQRDFERLAYTDTLTGLANRRLYGEQVTRLLARAPADATPFGLALLDLDQFKSVNDAFGHDVGDALLVEVADRLTAAVRKGDQVFRMGGDEFALILPGIDRDDGVDFCERILAAFAAPVPVGTRSLTATLSIGVALFPRHGGTSEALYKAADRALYEAKAAGRNTWRILA